MMWSLSSAIASRRGSAAAVIALATSVVAVLIPVRASARVVVPQRFKSSSGIVLVSRGAKGAIAIARDWALEGKCSDDIGRADSTVGCGDYLLAGFVGATSAGGPDDKAGAAAALSQAVKTATAKAWGQTEVTDWPEADDTIKVEIDEID